MQYRLGVFGWLPRRGAISANLGLRDTNTALRFSRSLLGPAGENLLLFGQSAGSEMTAMHLVSPPLYRGGPGEPPVLQAAMLIEGFFIGKPPQAADKIADTFLAASPCAAFGSSIGSASGWAPGALTCLRNVSVGTLLQLQARLFTLEMEEGQQHGEYHFIHGGRSAVSSTRSVVSSSSAFYGVQCYFCPTIDAETVPTNPATVIARGEQLHVPIILGSNAEFARWSFIYEGGAMDSSRHTGQAQYDHVINNMCNFPAWQLCRAAEVPALLAQYPCASNADCKQPFAQLMVDTLMLCYKRRLMRWLAAADVPTYAYVWQWRPSCMDTLAQFGILPEWGAYHMSEVSFLFRPYANCTRSAEDVVLATGWGRMLDSLLASGNPGCIPSTSAEHGHGSGDAAGCVRWPAAGAAGKTLLLGNWYNRSAPLSAVVTDADLTSGGALGDGQTPLESSCMLQDRLFWLPDTDGRDAGAVAASTLQRAERSPSLNTVSMTSPASRALDVLATTCLAGLVRFAGMYRSGSRHRLV